MSMETMSINEILNALEKLKDPDWENCQPVQRFIEISPTKISSDPSWRRVQLITLLIHKMSSPSAANTQDALILSVSQRKTLSEAFDFFVGYAVRPNLLPAVWRSTQKVPATEPRKALEEHRRLVASVNLLRYFASIPQLGSVLYEKHLSDLLIALFQLCHAPIRKTDRVSECKHPKNDHKTDIKEWLLHGLDITNNDEVITIETVVEEMQFDRLQLLPDLDHLVTTLFQPAVIKCLMGILSQKNPAWLRKACSNRLSRALLGKHGLAHLLVAVSEFFGADTAEWKQVENLASLVARCPSFLDEVMYMNNIGEQLHSIMFLCKDPAQFRLIVAVLNSFLASNSMAAIDRVFYRCFKNVVDVLRGQGAVSSSELSEHFTFVKRALDVLPHDAVLLEAFVILMPVYVKVAVFGHGSASAMTKQATEVVAKLADKIEVGPSVLIGVLDPAEKRFPMHPNLRPSFADDCGIQVTTEDRADVQDINQFSVDVYVEFLVSLGNIQPKLLPRLFLASLRKFDQLTESDAVTEAAIFYRLVIASLIASLNPLVQEAIQADIELMTEFALLNIQRCFVTSSSRDDEDSLSLTLSMLETLASNCDQMSQVSLERLKLAAKLLQNVSGHLSERCADLFRVISKLEVIQGVKEYEHSEPFVSWKFAPLAIKSLFNIEWNQVDVSNANEELVDWKEPTLEELITNRIQRNKKMIKTSVYGITTEYRCVKEQLQSPCVATRGHGYIQLRKLLSAKDTEAMNDFHWITELCRQGMEESDSYIYLGAVQCFVLLVELDTATQLPLLADALTDASLKDNRIRVLLAECLARSIPSFGDMIPVYSQRLIEVLLSCCHEEEMLMRVFGCSLLGEVIGRLLNVERIFCQSLNIIVTLMTSDQSAMVRWAAAEGLATLIKGMDKTILVRDYGAQVRDIHRLVKHLYANNDDQRLQTHLQEILFALGDLAKQLLQGIDSDYNTQMRKMKL